MKREIVIANPRSAWVKQSSFLDRHEQTQPLHEIDYLDIPAFLRRKEEEQVV